MNCSTPESKASDFHRDCRGRRPWCPGGGQNSTTVITRGPAPLSARDFFLVQRIFGGHFGARRSTASSSLAMASAKPKQTHSFWNRSWCALLGPVFVSFEFDQFFSGGRQGVGGGRISAASRDGTGGAAARIFAAVSKNFFLALARHCVRHRCPFALLSLPQLTSSQKNCREIQGGGGGSMPTGELS
jgi:hypothetical protein